MLKRPSVVAPLRPPSAAVATAMEVESTRVETLPDGKKLIDVTMRRAHPSARDNEKLVVPQFDDDESSSSSSDDDEGGAPQHYESPVKKSIVSGLHDRDDDEEEDGVENNNNTIDVRQSVAGFQGEFQWSGVQDIQALTHTNAALHEQIAELKAQLKTSQIQLEALAPVPGLNASAVQDILLDKDGTEHDIRDTKIVHQAKTLRHLKRTLQREKQLAVDAVKQCKAMEAHAAALEKENDTLKLKLARFQARASAAATPTPVMPPSQDEGGPQTAGETNTAATATGKEKESLGAYKKKYEDMRIRHDKLLADLKKTQRALVREVGDDVSLDELIDGSGGNGAENARRGRAQQIIMLKAKVRKLEQELAKGPTELPTGGPNSANNDVDQRAMQDLSAQHTQRQRLLDKLTAERDELLERHQQLSKKFDALRSRTQTLEKEKQDHKSKLQVLVDKSRNDDALVDALQRQLETWKGKLQEAKRARTAESSSLGSGGGGAGGGLPKDERMELDRLRAIVADFKRQQSTNQTSAGSVSSGCMPLPSETAQYRSITAEKERLVEQVKVLQSQLEDKDRQIRGLKNPGDQNTTTNYPPVSRIPRLGSGTLPPSQYFPTPPAVVGDTSALEAQKRSFRDAMVTKEQEIEALKLQLQRLTQQQQADAGAHQEIQDLHEENEYLRQEFDRLKTRYEAVLKSSRKATG